MIVIFHPLENILFDSLNFLNKNLLLLLLFGLYLAQSQPTKAAN